MDLNSGLIRFNEIAEKTGILSRAEQKVEPTHEQRDELWDITRISRDYKQYDSLKNGGCFFWVHRHFMNILIVGANYLNGLDRMMMTARQVNRITKTKLTVRSK
jgi:hypothetical protein|tara:strand:- start:98 stop:409 length:312 start_codon:yes stop_codon:yes gene_type:complete